MIKVLKTAQNLKKMNQITLKLNSNNINNDL